MTILWAVDCCTTRQTCCEGINAERNRNKQVTLHKNNLVDSGLWCCKVMNAISSSSDQSDKYVDRSRINFWIQSIARILNKSVKKMSQEDLYQIQCATCRLLSLIEQSEKPSKDAFLKNTLAIDTLITVLQIVACEITVCNIISIFIEVVGKVHLAKRALVLVNHGLTTVLFQILKLVHTNDISLSDNVLIYIHVLMSRIGHKDCKFAVKARLHQNLMLTLNLIKVHFHNFRNLQPLLQVLKMYTNNSVNASELGKQNAVSIMLKVIAICGKRHTVDLKLALENLCNLTKSKNNSLKLIDLNGVPQLLSHHCEWQHLDTKHRHVAIRRCILLVLRNVTEIKFGRMALVEADGIRILYEGALEASDCRDMEGLIMLSSTILRKCCPKNKLPLDSFLCPVLFPLPASSTHTPECYFLTNFPTPSDDIQNSLTAVESEQTSLDDDDDDDDDDDNYDSDEERFRNDTEEPIEDQQGSPQPSEFRELEDLRMYDSFFPELLEQQFQALPSSCCRSPSLQRSLSGNLSMLPVSMSQFKSVPSDAHLKKVNSDLASASGLFPGHHSQSLSALGTSLQGDKSASAINLKTGSSVITLDLGCYWSPSPGRSNRSTPKGKIRKKFTKEKTCIRKSSTTCLDKLLSDGISGLTISGQDSDEMKYPISEDPDSDLCSFTHDPLLYIDMISCTQSVYKFNKLAYPDMNGVKAVLSSETEHLWPRKFGVQRAKIFEDIDRMIHSECVMEDVVYDLDKLISSRSNDARCDNSVLTNMDELRAGMIDAGCNILKFNAQFECGNLRKVIKIRQFEYDLILSPDINSDHHHQWFYFEISNMQADKSYRFNIVNCEKQNSQFNFGMQPLLMSVIEARQGNPCWKRVGTDICYYKNHFTRHCNSSSGNHGKTYYTATFTITFQYTGDVCYISYHYPYSYTALQTHLLQWEQNYDSSLIFFRKQTLCTTLAGNTVPVLTITAQPRSLDKEGLEELRSRPYIFLSGRVHPGESNASWVMKGTIDYLLSNKSEAHLVRERYIFKIVPMLNPDGVINGNHRSSLAGEDLNRQWGNPCKVLHPTIYHTKGLLQYLHMINKTPMVYCDYHGHSRRKNIFLYGCSPNQTWIANDTQNPACTGNKPTDFSYKQLPRLLDAACPTFCLKNCSYVVEKGKENTARVVVWRHIGVVRSYTMESSYCGCDQGQYKDMQINTYMLEEMGHKFCGTLLKLASQKGAYDQQMPIFDHEFAMGSEPTAEDFEEDVDERGTKKKRSKIDSMLDDSDSYDDEDDDEEEEFDDDE